MSKQLSANPKISGLSAVRLSAFAWALSLLVCLLAIIAWGDTFSWRIFPLNVYAFFPLLGLLAFSLMWTHYVVGTAKDMLHVNTPRIWSFYRYTGYAVLLLICLHPGLLIYQRFRDGYGLPPKSYETYVAPSLSWITLLGTVSLLVFLAFELRRIFGTRQWWHFVVEAGDLAMLAIAYHGLRLGTQLQMGWFKYVWLFYAAVLAAILVRKYYRKFSGGAIRVKQ
jgi:hypothetical protein